MAKDFEAEFEQFVIGNNGSVIRDIHSIIPTLDDMQMQILNDLMFWATKYDIPEWFRYIDLFNDSKSKNKDLGIMKSMTVKSFLKAYTMEEYLRGIKISQNSTQGEK